MILEVVGLSGKQRANFGYLGSNLSTLNWGVATEVEEHEQGINKNREEDEDDDDCGDEEDDTAWKQKKRNRGGTRLGEDCKMHG